MRPIKHWWLWLFDNSAFSGFYADTRRSLDKWTYDHVRS